MSFGVTGALYASCTAGGSTHFARDSTKIGRPAFRTKLLSWPASKRRRCRSVLVTVLLFWPNSSPVMSLCTARRVSL